MRPGVVLVVPELAAGGGVPAVAMFLYDAILGDGRWRVDLVSVPSSSRDADSVRILSPRSWVRGCTTSSRLFDGRPFRHIGAIAAELEFARYQPRKALTDALRDYDLVHVVCGGPAVANSVLRANRPTVAFVATLAEAERATRLSQMHGARRAWFEMMTRVTTRIEQHALSSLRHVFAESAYTRDLIVRHVSADRVSIAPPGVDTRIFRPATRYTTDGPILSVGRFGDPRKNVRMLFRAYRILLDARPNAPKLVLAGQSSPPQAEVLYARDLGLDGRWEMRLGLSIDELAETYRRASVFVLTSNEEGLGIVILEAMASGLPVVATRCGGPDLIVLEGETGHLVARDDASALASRLISLLDNQPLRQAMSGRAFDRAAAHYSYAAAAREYFSVYERFLRVQ